MGQLMTMEQRPACEPGVDEVVAETDEVQIAEQLRIAALQATELLDTERELEFDQVIELAAGICGTPMSMFSLVDETRQWFKASVGVAVRETPREHAFCSRAIQQPDLFVVEDAQRDPRFWDNPFVTSEPSIRFYAGMPMAGPDGHILGTLCVADVVPRQLTSSQKTALQILATQLKARVELRVQRRRLQAALEAQESLVWAVRASDNRFRTFMNHAPFLAFIKDAEGRFVYYNRRFAEQFEVSSEAWLGKRVQEVLPGDLAETYCANDVEAMRSAGVIEVEEETRDEHGRVMFWRSSKFALLNEKGERMLGGLAVDITEEVLRRKSLENTNAALERFAMVDALTGLVNRRALDERLAAEFREAKAGNGPLSVLLLDIDNFKRRNDTFGHRSGDDVLRRMGRLLEVTVRTTDVAGRYGGEEMLVVLPRTDACGARLLAQRIQRAMAAESWPDCRVTASFGVASTDGTTRTVEELVGQADRAMYEAKRLGKDRIVGYWQLEAEAESVA